MIMQHKKKIIKTSLITKKKWILRWNQRWIKLAKCIKQSVVMPSISILYNNMPIEESKVQTNGNAEFYLLLIAIKLGFLSGAKIIKTLISAYKIHKRSLKRKYMERNIEAAIVPI